MDRNCLVDNVRCENLEAAEKVRFLFEQDCVDALSKQLQILP